jgi:SAM-dependent methyltransferase
MITWDGRKYFSIDDVRFTIVGWKESKLQTPQGADELLVFKHPWMIDAYVALLETLQPRNIFELGIFKGGSCVFFHRLARARKLVAIELDRQRVFAVDNYIKQQELENSLVPIYGVDQADRQRLNEIVDEQFGHEQLDLVIDDASHFLDETRSSFNSLFPRLRPGGVYIIEDWSWAHGPMDLPDDTTGFYPEREPLTKLLFELVLACGSNPDLIEKIEINSNSAFVWRGASTVEAKDFDIARCSLARGRNLIA